MPLEITVPVLFPVLAPGACKMLTGQGIAVIEHTLFPAINASIRLEMALHGLQAGKFAREIPAFLPVDFAALEPLMQLILQAGVTALVSTTVLMVGESRQGAAQGHDGKGWN